MSEYLSRRRSQRTMVFLLSFTLKVHLGIDLVNILSFLSSSNVAIANYLKFDFSNECVLSCNRFKAFNILNLFGVSFEMSYY